MEAFWICVEMALAVLTKSQDPGVLASVASCEDVIPLAFHSVPWQWCCGMHGHDWWLGSEQGDEPHACSRQAEVGFKICFALFGL